MWINKQYLNLALAFVQPFPDIRGGTAFFQLGSELCLVEMFFVLFCLVVVFSDIDVANYHRLRLNSRNYAFSPVAVVSGWRYGSMTADTDTLHTNTSVVRLHYAAAEFRK